MRWNNKQLANVRKKRQRRETQHLVDLRNEFLSMIQQHESNWTGHESAAGLN